jgi:flagellar M-ring protein FliF
MNARFRDLWTQLRAFVLALPPVRRVAVLATGAGSLVLVLVVAWWAGQPLYRPLFTNLAQEDAAAIVAALKSEKVPYQLEDGGRAVLVPVERLYELRLSLASRGLPEGGGVGFEIFDKQQLGQTDFVQHLNYQRALQGELGRTITDLGGVESARVHLAIPERSLFVSQERRPTASVAVKLLRGRTLSRAQIDGIVHLVASSVQGMAPDDVTVVDEGGRMLTAGRHGDDAPAVDSGAAEYQRGIERAAEERIESLLATIVGPGKVMARVAATLDLARTERTEEIYDPDKTVLRESHSTREDTAGAKPAAGGVGTERRDETQSFDVSKTTSRTVAPMGAVKALSVAVLIDGTYRDEKGTRVFVPRTDDELERLKAIVASAVGVSEARGDRLEITSAPFRTPAAETAADVPGPAAQWVPEILLRLLGVGLVVAVLGFVVRPLVQAIGTAGRRTEPRPGGFALERDGAVGELARENVALAQQHPERAAQLVRQWLLDTKAGA